MDGKTLGEIHSGPYGIPKGLGIIEKNVSKYLKELKERSFLLVIIGYEYELVKLQALVVNRE